MTKFTISIDTETDGRIIAEVPELPGVMVYGSSEEEAVRKVKELAAQVLRDKRIHGDPPFRPVRSRARLAQSLSKQLNEAAQKFRRRILHK